MRACTTTSPVPAMQTICTPRFLTNVSSSPRIVLPPSNYSPCLRIALPLHVSRLRIGGDRQISTWSSRLDLSKDLARQRSTVAKVALLFFFFRPRYTSRIGERIGWRSFSFLFCESGSSAASNRAKWFDDRVFFFFFFSSLLFRLGLLR